MTEKEINQTNNQVMSKSAGIPKDLATPKKIINLAVKSTLNIKFQMADQLITFLLLSTAAIDCVKYFLKFLYI